MEEKILQTTSFFANCTHGSNESILFAEILDPYEVTQREFAKNKG